MKQLDQYIAKTIFTATGLATLIMVSVLIIMMMLTEMKNIGTGDYDIQNAILYVVMRLPNELYQFSPMLILLGSIIGLSVLASHRELTVMRASGFSVMRLILAVLSAVLLLTLAIAVIGEWVAPDLSYKAEVRKENAKNPGLAVTASGVWLHVDNNFIHIQHVVGRQLLEGITRYQFDHQHQLQVAYFAKTLSLHDKEWRMHDVVKTTFHPERTKSEAITEAPWELKINPNLFNLGLLEPNEMSLPKLLRLSRYLTQNGLQATEYQYEFWHRVLQPFASVIMIFLAIPVVLTTKPRKTFGFRILIGIVTGFAFFILNATLSQLSIVYQLPPLSAALFPICLFALIGIFLCKKALRHS